MASTSEPQIIVLVDTPSGPLERTTLSPLNRGLAYHVPHQRTEAFMPRLLAVAALAFVLAAPLSDAKTLRWSSQGDYLTADPMAQNELLTNSINGHVYESLVERGKKLEILPALATSWKQTSPTV